MKVFIASVVQADLSEALNYGAHGVITNPTVIAEANLPWKRAVEQAAETIDGPFHLQATATDLKDILLQVKDFQSVLGSRLVAKLMITQQTLAAIPLLKEQGIAINITGIITPLQAAIAAQAGADFVAVYVGRAERSGSSGLQVIHEIARYFRIHDYPTKIVAASLQHLNHLWASGLNGAHIAACPLSLLQQSIEHPTTNESIATFLDDWARIPRDVSPSSVVS